MPPVLVFFSFFIFFFIIFFKASSTPSVGLELRDPDIKGPRALPTDQPGAP